ncbi:hypothetical protein AB0L49_47490, partial [Streptomyces antimycoticus]|uniref:hypothetical protein n=1 Tax=Streptomyces antimycoticus TaxID=68175 RepID=UPI00343B5C40
NRPRRAAGEGRRVTDLDLAGWHERRMHEQGPLLEGSGRKSTGPHAATEGATPYTIYLLACQTFGWFALLARSGSS